MAQDTTTVDEGLDKIDFNELLKKAARPLSKEERREQMVSFAMGMMSEESTVSREEMERYVSERWF
jgi:hypothetical protein